MKLKKKRIMSIDEINAYQIAYGKPIQRKELLTSILKPFMVCFFLTFLLFWIWWVALIGGLIGMLYGYAVLIPQSVKRVYEEKAFRERNNFINYMTQILTNNDRTIVQAIQKVRKRASGEFQEDLSRLEAVLMDANESETVAAFKELEKKYKKDVVFTLYLEQLTTALINGRTNVDSIKNIKHYHNQIKEKQAEFLNAKQGKANDFKFMAKVSFFFIVAIIWSFGLKTFIEVYAHYPIGWASSILFLIILGTIYHSFVKRMGDDSIMEVKV